MNVNRISMTTVLALSDKRQHTSAVSAITVDVVITTKAEEKQDMSRNRC